MQEPQQQQPRIEAVTGAFSYTGRFIARRLLEDGRRVRTLTNHSHRPGAEDVEAAVEVEPLRFDDRSRLIASLRGVDVLYNTYWVRFPHSGLDFDLAVGNFQRTLIEQAIQKSGGNKTLAADLLRMKRTTLLAKLRNIETLANVVSIKSA